MVPPWRAFDYVIQDITILIIIITTTSSLQSPHIAISTHGTAVDNWRNAIKVCASNSKVSSL
jgi:hypothetical protein